MEANRFDELSKAFAEGVPRRTFVRLLAGGLVAGLFGLGAAGNVSADDDNDHNGRNGHGNGDDGHNGHNGHNGQGDDHGEGDDDHQGDDNDHGRRPGGTCVAPNVQCGSTCGQQAGTPCTSASQCVSGLCLDPTDNPAGPNNPGTCRGRVSMDICQCNQACQSGVCTNGFCA
jgi:hypothetical protein